MASCTSVNCCYEVGVVYLDKNMFFFFYSFMEGTNEFIEFKLESTIPTKGRMSEFTLLEISII